MRAHEIAFPCGRPRRHTRILRPLQALLLSVLAAAACRNDLADTPERTGIVTFAPHITEAVFALGQGHRVVGVTAYCDYPPEAQACEKVGGYIDPNIEKLTMLAPKTLIVQGKHEKVAHIAETIGADILHVDMDNLAGIDQGIATLGQALGCQPEADALRADLQARLDAVRDAVRGRPRPKVFIISSRNARKLDSLFTVGGRSFVSELVAVAGGDNVYADAGEPYLEASKETVVVKAPDVIIEFHAGEALSEEEQAQFIADWQRLPSIPAVRNGRIYLILESHALRPGPRAPDIARGIARLLHPDADLPAP